jgi:hypothetical protein
MRNSSYLSACEDGIECSETLAYKIQTPGNHPVEKKYAIFYESVALHAGEWGAAAVYGLQDGDDEIRGCVVVEGRECDVW